MKTEAVQTLTTDFEAHAKKTENGAEFWLARDLQNLLGYTKWDNFFNIVLKAKTSCEAFKHNASDHFADVSKMVDLGFGSQCEVDDIMLIGSALLERGIVPENLPAVEDVKKVERRLNSEVKKLLKKLKS